MSEKPSVYLMMPMREEMSVNLLPWLSAENVAARWPCRLRAIVAWHVVSARNECVRELLRSDSDYLLMVDDDTIIPPDTIERLIALDADVATGITPIVRVGVLMSNIVSKGLASKCSRPPHMADIGALTTPQVHDIELCGMSCVLVRRKVLETIEYPWFAWNEDKEGNVDSEDMLFCHRVRELGLTIRADTGLVCGHLKKIDLRRLICRGESAAAITGHVEAATIDPYATHLPALLACLTHSTGSVLELGCGMYSTPILAECCRLQKRQLTSLDNDSSWHQRLIALLDGVHKIRSVPDWAACSLPDQHWGMALVDHTPADRRVPEIRRLAHAGTDFIVAHDTESGFYGYEPLFKEFKHYYTYDRLKPWTTIFSNGDNWPAAWSKP